MKILVISDSHGNIVRLKHVLGFAKRAKIPTIIHCGDWDNLEAVETIRDSGIDLCAVLGNADEARKSEIWEAMEDMIASFDPEFLKFWTAGRTIGVCHSPGKLKDAIKSQKYDALFCGHTHKRGKKTEGKTLIVNPGALHKTAQPSFAVYDTRMNDVEFVDLAI